MREYYGDKGPDDEDKKKKGVSTNVAGPVTAWLVLLFVALAIRVFTSTGTIGSGGSIGSALSAAANFILFTPGDIILPLVIGAAVGAEVGMHADSLRKAELSGLMNGVYAAIVYTIGIVVIYEVLSSVFATIAPSVEFLLTSWIALPIAVCVVLSLVFSVLSYSRKVNS